MLLTPRCTLVSLVRLLMSIRAHIKLLIPYSAMDDRKNWTLLNRVYSHWQQNTKRNSFPSPPTQLYGWVTVPYRFGESLYLTDMVSHCTLQIWWVTVPYRCGEKPWCLFRFQIVTAEMCLQLLVQDFIILEICAISNTILINKHYWPRQMFWLAVDWTSTISHSR